MDDNPYQSPEYEPEPCRACRCLLCDGMVVLFDAAAFLFGVAVGAAGTFLYFRNTP